MDILDASAFGKLVKDYRKSARLTQFQLADMIEIDDKQLSKIERGIHYPSVPTFLKIIKILNIDLDEMYLSSEVNLKSSKNKTIKLLSNLSPKQADMVYKILEIFAHY